MTGGGGAPISYDRRRRRQENVGGGAAAEAHSSNLDTSDPELEHASSVAIVIENGNPPYIRYSTGMKVLGKRLTEAVSESVCYAFQSHQRNHINQIATDVIVN